MKSHGAAPCEAEGRPTATPIPEALGTFDASYFLTAGMRVSSRALCRSSVRALPTPELGGDADRRQTLTPRELARPCTDVGYAWHGRVLLEAYSAEDSTRLCACCVASAALWLGSLCE